MDLEFLQRLAVAITTQFGESSEVVVHDISGDDTEHTIAVIENGHVSHRQAGGGASRVVLEAIQRKDDPTLVDELGYLTRTRDGRVLKSSTVYLRNPEGRIEGVLCINYDITELLMAERAIASVLHHNSEPSVPTAFRRTSTTCWTTSLNRASPSWANPSP